MGPGTDGLPEGEALAQGRYSCFEGRKLTPNAETLNYMCLLLPLAAVGCDRAMESICPAVKYHQGVEPQTEKLRGCDGTGRPSAKMLRPTRDLHLKRLDLVADLETAILEPALSCLTMNTVALDGQPCSLTSCATERLTNLELATDTGTLGVNGATTAKTHFALKRHTGRSASRSGVGPASEVRIIQSALHDR